MSAVFRDNPARKPRLCRSLESVDGRILAWPFCLHRMNVFETPLPQARVSILRVDIETDHNPEGVYSCLHGTWATRLRGYALPTIRNSRNGLRLRNPRPLPTWQACLPFPQWSCGEHGAARDRCASNPPGITITMSLRTHFIARSLLLNTLQA